LDPFTKFVTLPILWLTLTAITAAAFAVNVVVGVIVAWIAALVGYGLQLQMNQRDRQDLSQ
jgi:hypothetical protein